QRRLLRFVHDFQRVDTSVVSGRGEGDHDLALMVCLQAMKRDGGEMADAAGLSEDVEIAPNADPIDDDVEDPAADATRTGAAGPKPVLRKIHRHTVPAGLWHRDGVAQISESLAAEHLGLGAGDGRFGASDHLAAWGVKV